MIQYRVRPQFETSKHSLKPLVLGDGEFDVLHVHGGGLATDLNASKLLVISDAGWRGMLDLDRSTGVL